MEAKAVSRYARISSLKVMKVSGTVKGKPVETALAILKFLPQKAAKQLEKLIRSAVANADRTPDVDVDRLIRRPTGGATGRWKDKPQTELGDEVSRWSAAHASLHGRLHRVDLVPPTDRNRCAAVAHGVYPERPHGVGLLRSRSEVRPCKSERRANVRFFD